MSFDITNAFVQQYSANVQFLSQQHGSRLRNFVTAESGVRGTYAFKDQIGVVGYNTVINRNGDTPLNQTPFARRRAQLLGRDWGDLVDKIDKLQMLIDPTSGTAMAAAMSMGRAIDDVIIASFFATSYTDSGLDGVSPTSVALPTTQRIAVTDRTYQDEGNAASGNSSLTVSKLISAKVLFFNANVDLDNETPQVAVSGQTIGALLTATPVTSIYYNQVRPLVEGTVDKFMGYDFHRTQLVVTSGQGVSLLNGSGYQQIPVWVPSGLYLAIGEDIVAEIAKNPGKRFSWQLYYQMLMGATRMEEVKVVNLLCDPAKTN